ncbi:MAG TPA: hypothetical protein VN634_19725 [Candidatus Limnocylindrales bacterium]|nr:hypothetical protein [Candidatus Limnocylindrales bacterium]
MEEDVELGTHLFAEVSDKTARAARLCLVDLQPRGLEETSSGEFHAGEGEHQAVIGSAPLKGGQDGRLENALGQRSTDKVFS